MTHDEHVEKIKAEAVTEGRDPATRRLLVVLAILLFLFIGVVGWAGYVTYQSLNDDVATEQAAKGAAADTADTNKIAAEDACEQVEKLGKKCAVDTAELDTGGEAIKTVTGKAGATGRTGPQGPEPSDDRLLSLIQPLLLPLVNDAVVAACGGTSCKGDKGDPVKGDKGDTVVGQTGATGPVGGEGPKGDPGGEGPAGKDAPVIVDIRCQGGLTPMTFTYVFDDGSEITRECVILEPVEPDPEESG